MQVRGVEGMTLGELVRQVKAGGRFVVYPACIGLLFACVEVSSAVYFVRTGERHASRAGAWRSLLTILLGWWAIPWGPKKAWRALRENFTGGRDVTASVLKALAKQEGVETGSAPTLEADVPPPGPITRPVRTHAA